MSVRRKMDVLAAKALGESNQDCNQKDNMIVKNRLTGKGHGLFEEGESWNNEDVDKRPAEVVKNQAIMHSQRQQWQQQPSQPLLQGPIVRWENFLPVRSLKVMLVENDDSTRHVVSALLRNCSYEVRAVSNGLEAWKILQDLTNHVDLVLTEVAMPGLSGIDLLSKIMSQKTCKNIPVIMMSSNDSMSVVFKCLSNGAVDFLVKPIRKNELKNLWQHVWRKCHSSSGSGSESGIRIEKSTKAKSVDDDESDNDTRSTDEEDSEESTGLMYKNGSDNNSGTQTSCSKKALEIQIQPISQQGYLADSPGSICAQVIHSNLEAQSSNWVPTNVTKTFQKDDNAPDNVAMGKDLTIGTSRLLDTDVGNDENKQGKDAAVKYELQYKDNDNVINDVTDVSIPTANNEVTNDLPKVTMVKNVDPCEEKEPSLELSLKKLRDIGNSRANSQGQNILIHSDHSAFSRYNTTLTTNQTLTLNLESSTPVNYSLEVPKTESIQHLQGQGSNGSSNSIDMGSTTNNNVLTNPESCNDKSIPRSTVSVHHRYAYQLVHHGHNNPKVPDAKKMVDTEKTPPVHQHTQVEHHHHHHYHHHHHHMHGSQNHHQQLPLNNDDSSDKLGMGIEGNNDNYSSALEINNGNSGQTRKGISGITEGTNMTNDNKPLGACASGSGSRSGLDQDRLSLREAALNKFRQKRKERCFEKKVRYQSRKTLAEQRPRVRGQFVRQAVDENIKKDENNYTNS